MDTSPPDDGRWSPPDSGSYGSGKSQSKGNYPPPMAPAVIEAESAALEGELAARSAAISQILPSHINIDMFRRCALVAVQRNPELLFPQYRQSLFIALQLAATDGLLPDGKEGALIIRWDHKARKKLVSWQPMVWGIVKAARRAGLRSIAAHIVYEGEPFEIQLGDDEIIRHTRIPECAEKGLEAAVVVYAIAIMADGTKIRRHMLASRVRAVKASSQADKGPWHGPFEDEMWLKTGLRHLSKWLDLSSQDDATQRLRSALERTDDVIDLEAEQNAPALEHAPQAALEAPPDKLSVLEAQLAKATAPAVVDAEIAAEPPTQPATLLPERSPEREFADWMIGCIRQCETHEKISEFFRLPKCGKAMEKYRKKFPELYEEIHDAQIKRSLELSKLMDGERAV